MDLRLSEEHELIKESAREFAQRELKQGVIERDSQGTYPEEAVKKITASKIKSLSAGKMGHSTSEIGDMVASAVAG